MTLTCVQYAHFDLRRSRVAAHVVTLRLLLGTCVVASRRASQLCKNCAFHSLRFAFLEDCLVEEGGSVPRWRAAIGLESLLAQCLGDNERGRLDVNGKLSESSRLAVGHPMAIMPTVIGMPAASAPVTARSASDRVRLGFALFAYTSISAALRRTVQINIY